MLYFELDVEGKVVEVLAEDDAERLERQHGILRLTGRYAWQTIEQALSVCSQANALHDGKLYIVIDSGRGVSPRYDVIAAPAVGDLVSKAFNGDYYPAGTIVKISDSLRRVETSTGLVFWRRGQSSGWINQGTWYMVQGRINERNPSF